MGAQCCKGKPPIDFTQEVCFDHFKLLRSVGKGAFGKVCIVMRRDTKRLFAMKYMNKEKLLGKNALKNVYNERKILEMLNHPFIVNLWFAFQDDEDMFMVVDLMLGGDLRYHLQRYGPFSEERVRLYIAEISLALAYIHSRKIIHRDIKPDNILMDENGHVALADFNVAAFVPEKGDLLYTRAGTRPYMAPELISRQGYSYGADWWSVGIVMYEMLKGKHPFKGAKPEEIPDLICNGILKYPNTWSPDCISLCAGLLERDPKKRLGLSETNMSLKNHAFFKELDWNDVLEKKVTPAFLPDKDKVNCDAMYELEEMMLEDNPLHKKKQRLNKTSSQHDIAGNSANDEMRRICAKFKTYDRSKQPEFQNGEGRPVISAKSIATGGVPKHQNSVSTAALDLESEGNLTKTSEHEDHNHRHGSSAAEQHSAPEVE
eukprot:Colp12_sorted_trinity150504_noHs@20430